MSQSDTRRTLSNDSCGLIPMQHNPMAASMYGSQVVQVNRSSPSPANVSQQIRNLQMRQQQLERSVVIRDNERQQNTDELIKIITERNDRIIADSQQVMQEVRDSTGAVKEYVEQNSELIKDLKGFLGESKDVIVEMQKEVSSLIHLSTTKSKIRQVPLHLGNVDEGRSMHLGHLHEPYSETIGYQQLPINVSLDFQQQAAARTNSQVPDTMTAQFQNSGHYQNLGIPMGEYQQPYIPTHYYQKLGTGTFTYIHPGPGLFAAQFPANYAHPGKENTTQQKFSKGEKKSQSLKVHQHSFTAPSLPGINNPLHGAQSQEPHTYTTTVDRAEIPQELLDNVLDKVKQEMKQVEKKQHEEKEREEVLKAQMKEFIKANKEMQEKVKEQTEQRRREKIEMEHKKLMGQKEMLIKEREQTEKLERKQRRLEEELVRKQMEDKLKLEKIQNELMQLKQKQEIQQREEIGNVLRQLKEKEETEQSEEKKQREETQQMEQAKLKLLETIYKGQLEQKETFMQIQKELKEVKLKEEMKLKELIQQKQREEIQQRDQANMKLLETMRREQKEQKEKFEQIQNELQELKQKGIPQHWELMQQRKPNHQEKNRDAEFKVQIQSEETDANDFNDCNQRSNGPRSIYTTPSGRQIIKPTKFTISSHRSISDSIFCSQTGESNNILCSGILAKHDHDKEATNTSDFCHTTMRFKQALEIQTESNEPKIPKEPERSDKIQSFTSSNKCLPDSEKSINQWEILVKPIAGQAENFYSLSKDVTERFNEEEDEQVVFENDDSSSDSSDQASSDLSSEDFSIYDGPKYEGMVYRSKALTFFPTRDAGISENFEHVAILRLEPDESDRNRQNVRDEDNERFNNDNEKYQISSGPCSIPHHIIEVNGNKSVLKNGNKCDHQLSYDYKHLQDDRRYNFASESNTNFNLENQGTQSGICVEGCVQNKTIPTHCSFLESASYAGQVGCTGKLVSTGQEGSIGHDRNAGHWEGSRLGGYKEELEDMRPAGNRGKEESTKQGGSNEKVGNTRLWEENGQRGNTGQWVNTRQWEGNGQWESAGHWGNTQQWTDNGQWGNKVQWVNTRQWENNGAWGNAGKWGNTQQWEDNTKTGSSGEAGNMSIGIENEFFLKTGEGATTEENKNKGGGATTEVIPNIGMNVTIIEMVKSKIKDATSKVEQNTCGDVTKEWDQNTDGVVTIEGNENTGGVVATQVDQNTGGVVITELNQNTGGVVTTEVDENTGGVVSNEGDKSTGGVVSTEGVQNKGG
ncbi:unnamed protein product, partial [Lymnaea stagnalis]